MQWEFAGRLGPPPGRYVLRRYAGDDIRGVIVVSELGGVASARGRHRRLRRAAPGAQAAVAPVTRVTVAEPAPLPDAEAWLARAPRDPRVLRDAAAALARLVAARRVAAAEPLADPDPAAALVTRIGYGTGAQVAEGEWASAVELPPAGGPRRRRADPHVERLAALLAGRDAALACEELTLRARTDLDHERHREAALQLEAALGAALAELGAWRELGDLAARLDELAGHAEPVASAARAAREGRLDATGVETVTAALARLEAALRARAVYVARP